MLQAKPSPEFMEEDGQEETPRSPFWLQSTTNLSRTQRYRRRLSSLFFNSFVLIVFLLLFAGLSMVFIIPSLIHFSSHVFSPNLVKRSWDSINLILVLIALAFGFLSRNINNNNDDDKLSFEIDRSESELPAGVPIMSSYDLSDQLTGASIRLRTSSSYPDLRELSPPSKYTAVDHWRFSDDTHLNYYRVLESNRNNLRQRSRPENYPGIPAPPTPPSVPPVVVKKKTKRRAKSSEPRKILSPVIDQPPEGLESSSSASKEFFTSFYHKKKKKRQKERSLDNLHTLLDDFQPPAVRFQLPPPQQPPPPPPLPPPPRTVARAPRPTITRVAPFVTDKPRVPFPMISLNGIDDSSSGGDSPMKQIPPPPPLPPFKMSDWKFAVEGDFVTLQSTLSSRSASPDGEESRSPSSDVEARAVAPPLFCPSPDVDTKADSFIARFRAGLKLERMSKLGPGPNEI